MDDSEARLFRISDAFRRLAVDVLISGVEVAKTTERLSIREMEMRFLKSRTIWHEAANVDIDPQIWNRIPCSSRLQSCL